MWIYRRMSLLWFLSAGNVTRNIINLCIKPYISSYTSFLYRAFIIIQYRSNTNRQVHALVWCPGQNKRIAPLPCFEHAFKSLYYVRDRKRDFLCNKRVFIPLCQKSNITYHFFFLPLSQFIWGRCSMTSSPSILLYPSPLHHSHPSLSCPISHRQSIFF
jgi:hypothetical protein